MKSKFILSFAYILLFSNALFSQKFNRDSAEKKLELLPNDTIKVIALNNLCMTLLERMEGDSITEFNNLSRHIIDSLLARKKELHYQLRLKSMLGYTFLFDGMSHINHGLRIIEADSLFKDALKLSKESQDLLLQARINSATASIHMLKGDFKKAASFCHEAINVFQELNYPKDEAKAFRKLGLIYNKPGTTDKAADFFENALNMYKKLNDQKAVSQIYESLAMVNNSEKNFEKALKNHTEALNIYKSLRDSTNIAYVLNHIGQTYLLNKDTIRALVRIL